MVAWIILRAMDASVSPENSEIQPETSLLGRIEAYLAVSGMPDTTFGWEACRDAGMLRKLRAKGRCRSDRLVRVEAALERFWMEYCERLAPRVPVGVRGALARRLLALEAASLPEAH